MSTTNETKIKAYTTRELAELYGVSAKTFRTWLSPHLQAVGQRISRYYTAKQVGIIFQLLGEP